MKASDFGEEFMWGAAISAAQTESAALDEGKGHSIWDEFCKPRRRLFSLRSPIRDNHHIAGSSDFYFHYRQDIDSLKSMGFKHFRFSISWARVLPDGKTINPEGLAFPNGGKSKPIPVIVEVDPGVVMAEVLVIVKINVFGCELNSQTTVAVEI